MQRPKIKPGHGPEYGVQGLIVKMLREKGWHVERMPGGAMRGGGSQSGLPDLLACHPDYGIRFIEVKYEESFRFTVAQRWKFPLLFDYGCGIWVLTGDTDDQYARLFTHPNLWEYMKRSEVISRATIDGLFDQLES